MPTMAFRDQVIILGLVLMSCLGLSSCGRYVESDEERELGMKGLARVDKFLAAKRFLGEMGIETGSYAGLPKLPPPANTVLCIPARSLRNKGTFNEIDRWIRHQGGTTICFLQLDRKESIKKVGGKYPFERFLEFYQLEVEVDNNSESKSGQVKSVKFASNWGAINEYSTDYSSALKFRSSNGVDDDPYHYLKTYSIGQGKLVVMSTMAPFTNDLLKDEKHATLLWDMMTASDPEKIWLVSSSRVSFLKLLWQTAPYAICVAGVLIAAWLWSSAFRFGPRFATVDTVSNRLEDHLTASGYFFARHQADRLIIDQVKQTLTHSLARKINLPIDTPLAEIISACEQHSLLTPEQLDLFREAYPDKRNDQVVYLQQLQSLKKQL